MHKYGGLGDRHQQTVEGIATNYTLDLNAGLTQVLVDGTNTYLYGNTRISQHAATTEYFLGDALGSVRQLVDTAGAVTLAQSYAPYGDTLTSSGDGVSAYQYTGEARDASGLTYLRARYLNTGVGRFTSRDTWAGNYQNPISFNMWGYANANPVRFTDPSGQYIPCSQLPPRDREYCEAYKTNTRRSVAFYSTGRDWTAKDKEAVYDGVFSTAIAFKKLLNHMGYTIPKGNVFARIFGVVAFHAHPDTKIKYYCRRYALEPQGVICFDYSKDKITGPLIAHELAHVYNAEFSNRFQGVETPYKQLDRLARSQQGFSYVDMQGDSQKLIEYRVFEVDWYKNGRPVVGIDGKGNPILGNEGDTPIKHSESQLWRDRTVGQTNELLFSRRGLIGEEFADMFSNWVYDGFDLNNPAGIVRNSWMTNRLQEDMSLIFGLAPNPNLPSGCR